MAADAEIAAIVVVIKRKVKGNFTQSARFGGRFFLREAPTARHGSGSISIT
jgi:hypothetical protein